MKKNYFMLAAAVTLFAACAETDMVEEVNDVNVPQAIGFETFANKAVRAENSGAAYSQTLAAHHTTFKVWASKRLADGAYVDVYPADDPGTVSFTTVWTANPLKYWDKAASNYEFYAAAPSSLDWVATNTNTDEGYLTLASFGLSGTNLADSTSTPQDSWKGKSGDVDLMIADKCTIAASHYYDLTNNIPLYNVGNVNLNFNHILSRLNIAVKTDSEATIVVKKLDVVRLKNKGSFAENATLDTALTAGTTKRWDTTSSTTYTLSAYTGGRSDGLTLIKDGPAVYTHEYLVIPQTVTNTESTVNSGTAPGSDAYIYLEYTVGGELFKTYYGLAKVFNTDTLAFNEGWQNTLTITISPDVISFDANAAVWDTKTTHTPNID